MTEIDNKKMWEYLLNNIDEPKIVVCIEEALEEQGLKYENGEIVSIEPETKWYVALEDYGSYQNSIFGKLPLFLKGERTTKEKVFSMCSDIMCYTITEEEFNKHFRPATEEEISEAEYQRQDKGIEKALRKSYSSIEKGE